MTTYYVSPFGLDANNGLGPDPGHASNKPWLTIGKALGAAGIASGDTVKLCPGTYRETLSVGMTSATVETFVQGDVQNASGFKDGSGVTVNGGEVIWSAYTTNDKTAPAAAALLNLAGRDFLTFERIIFIGGNVATATCILATTTNSINIKFTECAFIPGHRTGPIVAYTGLADIACNWTFDRCLFLGIAVNVISFTFPTSASADYDTGWIVRNCLFIGGSTAVLVTPSGAGAFKAGGGSVFNCTAYSISNPFIWANGANLATSIPIVAYNNIIDSAFGFFASTVGQITEDYNLIYAGTPRTNTSTGANSIASSSSLTYALMVQFGQEVIIGSQLRPLLSPMVGSPLLGFGNQAGSPVVDAWNRIRPAGGLHGSPGIGYLERHDSWVKETTTTDAGSVAISITGPGDHDFKIPVDAVSTTISIKMRRDTTYGEATGLPQAILLANGEIGFAGETKTMVAADDTWETLTFTAFTPTQKGVVTLRVVSRDTTATGKTFADTLTVV